MPRGWSRAGSAAVVARARRGESGSQQRPLLDPGVWVGKVLEEGSSGQAGRWVLRQRGVERGYGSARARTEQSGERGEDPGRRKGKDLTRGPGLSVGDATSAGCGLSGELGSGSGPPGESSWASREGKKRMARGRLCQRAETGTRKLGCGVSERAGPFARERKRSSWARVEAFWAGQGNDEEAGLGC